MKNIIQSLAKIYISHRRINNESGQQFQLPVQNDINDLIQHQIAEIRPIAASSLS